MKRICTALAGLLLSAALAVPALANDFYQRPPVPSSRNQEKVTTTHRKLNGSLSKTATPSNKIVKNVQTGNTGGESTRPKASLQ